MAIVWGGTCPGCARGAAGTGSGCQGRPGLKRSRNNRCARRAAEAPSPHINAAPPPPRRPPPRPGAAALQSPFGGGRCGRALSVPEPPAAGEGRGRSALSGSATARAGPRPLRTHREAVPTTKMALGGRADRAALTRAPSNSPKRGLCFAQALHSRGPGARWRRRGGRGGGGAAAVADVAVPGACSPWPHAQVSGATAWPRPAVREEAAGAGSGGGGKRRRPAAAILERGRHCRRAPAVSAPRLRFPRPLPAAP